MIKFEKSVSTEILNLRQYYRLEYINSILNRLGIARRGKWEAFCSTE